MTSLHVLKNVPSSTDSDEPLFVCMGCWRLGHAGLFDIPCDSVRPFAFADLVRQAYHGLPHSLRTTLAAKDIIVTVADADPDEPERRYGVWQPYLKTITLYRATIERWPVDGGTVASTVERVLLHEIGHALGMDHPQLARFNL